MATGISCLPAYPRLISRCVLVRQLLPHYNPTTGYLRARGHLRFATLNCAWPTCPRTATPTDLPPHHSICAPTICHLTLAVTPRTTRCLRVRVVSSLVLFGHHFDIPARQARAGTLAAALVPSPTWLSMLGWDARATTVGRDILPALPHLEEGPPAHLVPGGVHSVGAYHAHLPIPARPHYAWEGGGLG